MAIQRQGAGHDRGALGLVGSRWFLSIAPAGPEFWCPGRGRSSRDRSRAPDLRPSAAATARKTPLSPSWDRSRRCAPIFWIHAHCRRHDKTIAQRGQSGKEPAVVDSAKYSDVAVRRAIPEELNLNLVLRPRWTNHRQVVIVVDLCSEFAVGQPAIIFEFLGQQRAGFCFVSTDLAQKRDPAKQQPPHW